MHRNSPSTPTHNLTSASNPCTTILIAVDNYLSGQIMKDNKSVTFNANGPPAYNASHMNNKSIFVFIKLV